MKKLASINEIEKLTEELTWMGGNPEEISVILKEYEFTQQALKYAIDKVMNGHNCNSTYHSALECKRILEYEIMILNKAAHRI